MCVIGNLGGGGRQHIKTVRQVRRTGPPAIVGEIGNGIYGTAKVGGAVEVPHEQVEMESNCSLGIRGMGWEYESEVRYVFRTDLDAHVSIGKVDL